MLTTAASMIDQFNMPNIRLMKEAGYRVRAVCNFEQGNTCDEQRIQELESTLCRMGGGPVASVGLSGEYLPSGTVDQGAPAVMGINRAISYCLYVQTK